MIRVYLGLMPYFSTILRFIKLERQEKVSWLRILKSIYSHASIFKTDLDWLHFGFGTLAIGGENIASAKNADMAVSFRGFDIGVYPIKHPNCYQKTWSKVSKIHVISDDIASLVFKHGFKGQAQIIKITPAIDTSHFHPSMQLNIESPLKLISVARLHWKKGLNYTIQALALLKQKGVKFEYRIIGKGPEEEALKFAAYQFGLQDQVIFMGRLESEDVKQELAKSHIYIQYSVQEGFCNAVLEAQGMGLLSIVSDAEGLSENVLDGKTGWVIDKRKPDLLALKIKEVLELPEAQQNKIRNSAILRVQQHFNIENQQKAFIEFYKSN
ncbi:glycosyltransferase family 4 protein [Winogradskyella sp. R77965]|uniref:glycosyltransferase family 4 protein n=1 Tax=Winogradskyella sp. R77965 TaxID=3093872 RepID=UPI0037DCCF55